MIRPVALALLALGACEDPTVCGQADDIVWECGAQERQTESCQAGTLDTCESECIVDSYTDGGCVAVYGPGDDGQLYRDCVTDCRVAR